MIKTFGDLVKGDSIFQVKGLEVIEFVVVGVKEAKDPRDIALLLDHPISFPLMFEKSLVVVRKDYYYWPTGRLFSDKEKAWEWLIEWATDRHKELSKEIDALISEFDRLDKFLGDVRKEKEFR